MTAKEAIHVDIATNWGGSLVFQGDVPDAVARSTQAALHVIQNQTGATNEELEVVSVAPFIYNDLVYVTVVTRRRVK